MSQNAIIVKIACIAASSSSICQEFQNLHAKSWNNSRRHFLTTQRQENTSRYNEQAEIIIELSFKNINEKK